MKYALSKLDNGLTLLVVPMPTLESATLTVWVRVGSRYEAQRVAGVSHFLEHMAFKGGKRYPSAKAVSEVIDAIGGEFNAGTSKEWTNFYIRARAKNLALCFDVLSDMLLNPLLKAEDIEREKGVIVEELSMYEDTPQKRVWDIFEQLIFKGNSLGRDIIGDRKSIRGVKRSDFVSYRNKHYFGENMLITVAGGIKPENVIKLARVHFGDIKRKGKTDFVKFVPKRKASQVKLHDQKKEQAHFVLGFLGNKMGHKDRFVEAVTASILGGGMSSRLFTEVREKRGLAYAVSSYLDHSLDTGYLSAYAGVDPKRIDEAINVTLDQFYVVASGQYPVSNQELKKAKEYLKGRLALSLENTMAVNEFFGLEYLLLKKVETPAQVYRKIDEVTKEDVYRVAKKFFKPERLNLAIIGPYQSQARFEKLVS